MIFKIELKNNKKILYKINNCSFCSKPFAVKKHNQKNCSPTCANRNKKKSYIKRKEYHGICICCSKNFTNKKTRKYCNDNCGKLYWARKNRLNNKDEINRIRRERRLQKEKKLTTRKQWEKIYFDVLHPIHKQFTKQAIEKLLLKVDSVKNGFVTRSKKHNVMCSITIEELRQLTLEAYGKTCKYCTKQLTIHNLTYDHILPISKNGETSLNNLQVICRTCNHIKGSLEEKNFYVLWNWLNSLDKELKNDLIRRLSGVIFN